MTNPQIPPPQAAALIDCREHLKRSAAALKAAAAIAPLSSEAGAIHAVLLDQVEAVERLQRVAS